MTLPRSRWAQAPILLLTCGVMAAFPLVNHFRHPAAFVDTGWFAQELNGGPPTQKAQNKDYPLWYATGRAFLAGDDYYPPSAGTVFPFMYPPFAGLLLGLLSTLGSSGMLVALVVLNVACVAVAVELSVRLAAGTGDVPLWLRVVPASVVLFSINDMFLLGQPNLGLLCLILGGLMLVRTGRGVAGGGLLAAAAAIKAFPVVVIVYLIWRRYWTAAAAMIAFTALFLVPLPATVRGWDRSVTELKRWADGMLFKQGESGFGQRPEQSLGWRNQSLFGVLHRLLRPVNTYADELIVPKEKLRELPMSDGQAAELDALPVPPQRELYVNVADVGYRGALVGIAVAAGLLGLGFVAAMPPRGRRTRATDALEFAILTMLVTVCTPYAYTYYFVWLLFPLTLSVYHGMTGPTRLDRRIGWGTVGLVVVLLILGVPLAAVGLDAVFGNTQLMMACGSLFWAAVVAAAGCAALLWRAGNRPGA